MNVNLYLKYNEAHYHYYYIYYYIILTEENTALNDQRLQDANMQRHFEHWPSVDGKTGGKLYRGYLVWTQTGMDGKK
jgi:hypothetical protein